ncbi:MAG: GMC family oxidoreductase N-terminal domain-containing protein, partial [Candidatus Puniceispirillaceae bacterium]
TVHQGRRWSAANAYLRPALKRGNLHLFTRMLADKILFEGKQAIGVQTLHRGKIKNILARKGVILSAGAIASPAILQRSGIGPAGLLKKYGIEIIADRPQTGTGFSCMSGRCVPAQGAMCISPVPMRAPPRKSGLTTSLTRMIYPISEKPCT